MKRSIFGDSTKAKAFRLIILFGIVSLFGDIIYEGARSINGQYLQTLGASATVVGLVAGLGEFLGYGLRLFSGYFSDKTKAYWVFTILGYSLLASVPLMALTGVWQIAALLNSIEKFINFSTKRGFLIIWNSRTYCQCYWSSCCYYGKTYLTLCFIFCCRGNDFCSS